MGSHYFIEDDSLAPDPKRFTYYYKSREYTFVTDSGVFSPDGIDGNAGLMLRHIPVLRGSLLDMGCGYGCIGILLGGEPLSFKTVAGMVLTVGGIVLLTVG